MPLTLRDVTLEAQLDNKRQQLELAERGYVHSEIEAELAVDPISVKLTTAHLASQEVEVLRLQAEYESLKGEQENRPA